ncbi:MAG: Dabb family protein [Bacteroidota bacterium]
MKKWNLWLLTLLFSVACHQASPELDAEMVALKKKLAASEAALAEVTKEETAFIHTVFFWMKPGTTEAQKKDFAERGLQQLMEISSIYRGYYGPPAMTKDQVVDNSYDFALVCHFKTPAAQDEYQVDPIHTKFIEDFQDLWERVVVYDNLTQPRQ